METPFDLIVLGAGSGGLAAAKRAASYGAKVAVVEGDRVGGTCVIRGCVPKKLLVYGSLFSEHFESAPSFGVDLTNYSIDSGKLLSNVREEVNRLNALHIGLLQKAGVQLIRGWGSFVDKNCILVSADISRGNTKRIFGKKILLAVGGRPYRPEIPGSELGWVSDDMFNLRSLPETILVVIRKSSGPTTFRMCGRRR